MKNKVMRAGLLLSFLGFASTAAIAADTDWEAKDSACILIPKDEPPIVIPFGVGKVQCEELRKTTAREWGIGVKKKHYQFDPRSATNPVRCVAQRKAEESNKLPLRVSFLAESGKCGEVSFLPKAGWKNKYLPFVEVPAVGAELIRFVEGIIP